MPNYNLTNYEIILCPYCKGTGVTTYHRPENNTILLSKQINPTNPCLVCKGHRVLYRVFHDMNLDEYNDAIKNIGCKNSS